MVQMPRACWVAALFLPEAFGVHLRKSGPIKNSPTDALTCLEDNSLEVSRDTLVFSNLGGMGTEHDNNVPDSIVFDNVFPSMGEQEQVQMAVTAVGSYYPGDRGNGVHGDMGTLSLAAGSNATLAFNFRDGEEAKTIASFMFTVVYMFGNDGQQKSMRVCGHDSYVLSPDSILRVVLEEDGCIELRSTGRYHEVEMPTYIRSLDEQQLSAAASFVYSKVSEFQVTFHVDPGLESGHFLYGGQSNTMCAPRAFCNSYECPKYFALTTGAATHYCASSTCMDIPDRDTCCELRLPDTCAPDTTMLFARGSLKFANLGGRGPDFKKPEAMVYSNVFPGRAKKIDLWVTALSPYSPSNAAMSGQFGNYGIVNVKDGTSVDLLFQFKRRGRMGRDFQVTFPFSFTILDFDMEQNGGGLEKVTFDGPVNFSLTNETKVKVHKEQLPDGTERTSFLATIPGSQPDNPVHPLRLTPMHLDKAVTIEFAPINEFRISFSVSNSSNPESESGRNFQFAGWTDTTCPHPLLCLEFPCPTGMVHKSVDDFLQCEGEECNAFDANRCCEPAALDICAWENTLVFKQDSLLLDNLGGQGPDFGMAPMMFLSDVSPGLSMEGNPMDLIIIATSTYNPGDSTFNGLNRGMMSLSVRGGSEVTLRFSFVDRVTQRITAVDKFYFTLLDVEAPKADSPMSVHISEADSVNITEHSLLTLKEIEDDAGTQWVKLSTSAIEDSHNDPTNPLGLAGGQRSRSATVFFSQKAAFEVKLRAASKEGENPGTTTFYFTGRSNSICPAPNSCISYACPAGSFLVPLASTVPCSGNCTFQQCCVTDERDECPKETTLSLSGAELAHSNLGGFGPDSGVEKLSFRNVFPDAEEPINLEVTTSFPGSYTPGDPSLNTVIGPAGSINVANGTTARLNFKLINGTAPDAALSMPPEGFWLTFLDIFHESSYNNVTPAEAGQTLRASKETTLGRKRASPPRSVVGGRMYVASTDAVSHRLAELTTISHSIASDGALVFHAGSFGPISTSNLNAVIPHQFALKGLQKASSVALKFNSTEFSVTLGVEAGTAASKDFKFTGVTNVLCPARAQCTSYQCPINYKPRPLGDETVCMGAVCTDLDRDVCCELEACDPVQDMQFGPHSQILNNLGGYGPDNRTGIDEAIIFSDIFPLHNETVDLVIRRAPSAQYFPQNSSHNGRHGAFAEINVKAGSTATFRFSFVENKTGNPIKVKPFLFSVFDVDQQHVDGEERVTVMDAVWMATTPKTELRVVDRGTIWSGAYGNFLDNPTNPRSLTPLAMNRTATFLMSACTSFEVEVEVTQGFAGRNMIFGGSSNIVCPSRESCLSMVCPLGFEPVPERSYLLCAGAICRNTGPDVDTCCRKAETTPELLYAASSKALLYPADERRATRVGKTQIPNYQIAT